MSHDVGTGTRVGVRWALVVVAGLFVGCVVVQFFLAGLGVFDRSAGFDGHRNFGYLFGWMTLVMLALAVVGQVSRRLVGLTALALVLFALQSVLVAVRSDYPAIAALHPVNGVALLLVAISIARLAWATRPSTRRRSIDRAADEKVSVGTDATVRP